MISSDDVILVTGAHGFIGSDVVARILRQGGRVRAMHRRSAIANPVQHERLQVVHADMRDADSIVEAVRNVAAVIHLAAAKADERDSEDVNVGGARRLVAACRAAGCRRVINVSTQSVKIGRKGTYARTKSEADRVFRESGLDVTSLLPSVVYGGRGSGVFATILKFVRKLPVVPVLGDGKWVSAPVHVSDVSQAIISCLKTDETIGRTYDIGGPDLIGFDDLIDRIQQSIGVHRPRVHVPFELALFGARLLALLPHPPVSVSNVLGSNQDTHLDTGPARRDFGFNPMSLAVGLQQALAAEAAGDPAVSRSPVKQEASDVELAHDCRLITRYLLDCDPTPELVARYRDAWRQFSSIGEISLDPQWRWLRRHSWALAFVDAAAALLRPDAAVRKQVFVMTALLETTPDHAEFFLESPGGLAGSIVELTVQGVRTVVKVMIGIPLLFWSRRI